MDLGAIHTIIASVRDLINADDRTTEQDDRLGEYLRSSLDALGAAGDYLAEAIMLEQDHAARVQVHYQTWEQARDVLDAADVPIPSVTMENGIFGVQFAKETADNADDEVGR